jgi:hypothetical protein
MDDRAYRTVGFAAGAQHDWLHPLLGSTTRDGRVPQAYMVALQHVAITLDRSAVWQTWWRDSGVSECELGIVAEGRLDHLRPSADIRRCDDRLRANFTCALPLGDGADFTGRAAAEVHAMFEVIREALTLPALPPAPPLGTLPPGVPGANGFAVTAKPLPSVPAELEPQGYLTLAQIQEFFG